MSSPFTLSYGAQGLREVVFAPLTGEDERADPGADALLVRLARPVPGCVYGDALVELSTGDRDRALAGLYDALYGSAIAADATCCDCRARFEMHFDLGELAERRRPELPCQGDPPVVALGDSLLRLPRRIDLAGSPEALLAQLTISGPVPQPEVAAQALEAADPGLDLDLSTTCPECGKEQLVPFSIAAFLEATLTRDRAFLVREVHLIALSYHWRLEEILSLSREERHAFVRLLIAEREAASMSLRRVS